MPIGAIITLSLVGAALIIFGIILIVLGGKPKFIKGTRYESKFGRLKTTFIIGKRIKQKLTKAQGERVALGCGLVNNIVRDAFFASGVVGNGDGFAKTRHIIVQLMNANSYVHMRDDRYVVYLSKSAACLSKTTCWFWGDEIPTVCVKANKDDPFLSVLDARGEPLVHELCHAYLDDYRADDQDHSDPRVWIEAGGKDTIQEKARVQTQKELISLRS